jgi:hypothetical protein
MSKKNTGIFVLCILMSVVIVERVMDSFSHTVLKGNVYYRDEINPFGMSNNVSATVLDVKEGWVLYQVKEPKLPTMNVSNPEFVVYTNSTKINNFKTNFPYFDTNILYGKKPKK